MSGPSTAHSTQPSFSVKCVMKARFAGRVVGPREDGSEPGKTVGFTVNVVGKFRVTVERHQVGGKVPVEF